MPVDVCDESTPRVEHELSSGAYLDFDERKTQLAETTGSIF
jgi:hypothetical protein